MATRDVHVLGRQAAVLARDPDRLAAHKTEFGANRAGAPLFDTPRFARNIEATYEKLARR